MEITITMSCTINGIVADINGDEEFLIDENWTLALNTINENDAVVYGRKTYDAISSWEANYIDDLKGKNIIVLTRYKKKVDSNNISYCNSIKEIIDLCSKRNYKKIAVVGGSEINTLFMKENIVNHIIVNYNPYVLGNGIPFFAKSDFEKELELIKVINKNNQIIQMYYDIKK